MATQIKISELPLASESALSLAADDRFIFNNDNVNTQTIKFANLVDAICEQNLTFTGNCQFTQKIVGPDGGDIQVGLDDLVDVQFQNVTSGQVMTYSGTQWINRDVKDVALQLDSLSVVVSDTPSGGGNLTYDNTSGEFTFTPAVEGSFTPNSISVVTSTAASGGGALAYNPSNSVFTFTPADAYTKAESYSKNEVDTFLAGKPNASNVYTKTEVDTALAAKASNVLVGVANGATNLGSFTGSTINANQNVKQCIQQLETAIESIDTSASYTKAETDTLLDAKVDVDGGITVVTTAPLGGGNLAYTSGTLNYQPADLSGLATTASLATVATTGSYTDLLNIPAAVDSYTKAEANALLDAKVDINGGLSVTNTTPSGTGSLSYNDNGTFTFQPADLTGYALLANPTFTGAPSAPTAAAGTNTTQLATTEFVTAGIAANNAAYIAVADLKTLVAGAADYAAFQTAIAAL
jgi:hypothetical protein